MTDSSAHYFASLLRPGWNVIDGGANVGVFTLLAAKAVSPTGRVCAVEASRITISLLEANLKVNGFDNVDITCAALFDRTGEAEFFSFGAGAGVSALRPAEDGGARETVRTTNLEALIETLPGRRVDAIKLDLEGAEAVTLGAEPEIVHDENPVLMLEVDRDHLATYGSSIEELEQLLPSNRYEFYAGFHRWGFAPLSNLRQLPRGSTDVVFIPRTL